MVVYAGSPNSPQYGTAILDELRRVMKDTSYESPQFELLALGVSGALVEVTDGHFITTINAGGTSVALSAHVASPVMVAADALDFDLSADGDYGTIEQLVLAIQEAGGYQVAMVEDGDPNHACTDLRMMPPVSIVEKPFLFKTRRWSDSELSTAVDRAVGRHNLSIPVDPTLAYGGPHTASTIPKDHEYFIILLSQIELMKVLMHDALKRRGTDMTATDYDLIKRSLEDEYNTALTRYIASHQGALPTSATEDMGSGDILLGHSYRESLHAPSYRDWAQPVANWGLGGQWVRDAIAPPPPGVQLMTTALPGGRVMLRWQPSRHISFWKYEIWRGTDPLVSNISDYVRPAGAIPPQGIKVRDEYQQGTYQWVDGYAGSPLASGTYYYRIYVFDKNGKAAEGAVTPALVP